MERALTPDQLIVSTSTLTVLSWVWFRGHFYETFLAIHLVLYILIITMLWFHVPRTQLNLLSLATATAVLIFGRVSWICLGYYRNRSLQPVNYVTIGTYNNRIFELKIKLKRPLYPRPGQYVFITAPTLPHAFGWIQGHPYSIAWYESISELTSEITIFVEARKGFSKLLADAPPNTILVLLNGPYGKLDDITKFDKIQLFSEGIGVAAKLSAVKILLQGHDKQTARVRRIDLAWYSRSEGECDHL